MALTPCHALFQFVVANDKLSLQMYQPSCDMFLGVPFNIASYSLLLHMVAQVTGFTPHEFIHTLGDAHIYHEHLEAVQTQLKRKPYSLPRLELNPKIKSIDAFKMQHIQLVDYQHHETIYAPHDCLTTKIKIFAGLTQCAMNCATTNRGRHPLLGRALLLRNAPLS